MKKFTFLFAVFSLLVSGASFSQGWTNVGNSYVCASGVNQLMKFNNEIYASGVPQITKWNGTSWASFANAYTPDKIWCIAVYNNEIYVCGSFSSIGTVVAGNIAKFNGNTWSAVGGGLGGTVSRIGVYNGELYAFGFNGDSIYNNSPMAKWNGTSWSALPGSNYFYGYVSDIAVYDSELYVVGSFYSMGGISASNIAKFNGTSWSGLGAGTNYITNVMTVMNSELYVGGYFTGAGGLTAGCMAKWNGAAWSTLGNGVGGYDHAGGLAAVHALAVYNNNLYVGGQFTSVGSGAGDDLAYWDGTNWHNVGAHGGGNCGGVYALGVFDNSLWVGGLFDTAGTITAPNIAVYTITTTSIVENPASTEPAIYPNPSNGIVHLQMENGIEAKEIYVTDLNGKRIMNQMLRISANNYLLDMSTLSNGIYLLNVETGGGTISKRIVKE